MTAITLTRSILFDGVNDYASAGNNSSLRPTSSFTLACWVLTSETGIFHRLISFPRTAASPWDSLFLSSRNTQFYNGTSTFGTAAISNVPSQWKHVAGTYDGTTLTFYVDGKVASTLTCSGSPFYFGDACTIGNWSTTAPTDPTNLNGKLTDPRIYGRCLSQSEIQQICSGTEPDTTSLLGYWPLTEASGTFANAGSATSSSLSLANGAVRDSEVPSFLPSSYFSDLWTPTQTTTTLWLDADAASTLYDATSGGSLVAANGAIARWEDKSGNGRHVTQTTSGNRPTRRTSVRSSLGIVRFDGTNDLLETTFASFGTSYAVVAVAMANNAASASGGLLSCRSKTLGDPINPQVSYNAAVSQFAVRNDAGTINSNSISGLSNSTWYLWGGVRDTNNVTTYRDGTPGTIGTNTIGTSVTTSVTSVGGLYSGTATPSAFWNGDIAEIVVCNVSDREKVEGYLAWKWYLVPSLPSGHPYKNSPPVSSAVMLSRRRRSTMGAGIL